MNKRELLTIEHLTKEYAGRRRFAGKPSPAVKAVEDVSFSVMEGETFGIVGESGCGKSTLGKCIVRLHKPTGGNLWFEDEGEKRDLSNLGKEESFRLRRKIQMVFQDPYSSLNPSHSILESFDEPLRVHGIGNRSQRQEKIAEMLRRVNLQPVYMFRFPGEFSGGQRQRICIARALAMEPEMIVCDEPVSALDVSVQAQVLNLMRELQESLGLTYIFIAHDLSVVQYMSDRIGVMYLGRIVEIADSERIHQSHLHPYTQALMSAVPVPVYGRKQERILLEGDVPSPVNPPPGCKFHPRCRYCMERCRQEEPELKWVGEGHYVACHLQGKTWRAAVQATNFPESLGKRL